MRGGASGVKRVMLAFMLAAILAGSCPQARADAMDYTLSGTERVAMPLAYAYERALYDFDGPLKGAQAICITAQGRVYIADTGNDRVIAADLSGRVYYVLTEADGLAFSGPAGVFASPDMGLYIADTNNSRILHFSEGGKYIETFDKPQSEALGDNYAFNPTAIAVSPVTGYIYTLKASAIMMIDARNQFRGYMGQPEIGFSLRDFVTRLFASETQMNQVRRREADPYLSFAMDADGMIAAASRDSVHGEIKVLNAIGKNSYREYGGASDWGSMGRAFWSLFNIGSFAGKAFVYAERRDDAGQAILPVLRDIAVDQQGIITVIEEKTCKLYQYNQDANLLAVFGGYSKQLGGFEQPTALAVAPDGRIYVLDAMKNNLQVFAPTEFMRKVHGAVVDYNKGAYDEALTLWDDVLKVNANYELARVGVGQALMKQKNYPEAMAQFRLANERTLYSEAWQKHRHELFRGYFGWVILAAVLIAVGFVFAVRGLLALSRRGAARFADTTRKKGVGESMAFGLGTLFHPIQTFSALRENRGTLQLWTAALLLTATIAVRIISEFLTAYPLMVMETRDINGVMEFFKLGLPLLSWAVAVYGTISVMDGEARFGEILMATAYATLPFILLTPVMTALSYVFSQGEGALFFTLSKSIWIWIFVLLILAIRVLNNYDVKKTMAVTIVSLGVMVLLWAIGFLFLSLLGEVYGFLDTLLRELRLIFL